MARVLCALSGGVDSSVAALLLKEGGHEVVGVFMRNGVSAEAARARSCCSASDAADAARVADRLGIAFFSVDFQEEFGGIMDRFVQDYRRGRTPSPCILCNQHIKFGQLFELASAVGASSVATGHYARREGQRLLRAADREKDQTYYLFCIPRDRLGRVLFPVGGLAKGEVRERAVAAGLPVAWKPESMEICFVPTGDYRDLVRRRAGPGRPGRFVDREGRDLGAHGGIEGFTVGQRRGLPPGPRARYVVGLRPGSAEVVLGFREDLLAEGARLSGAVWLGEGEAPTPREPLRVEARLRARHDGVEAYLAVEAGARATLRFARPDGPVTPGQAAVFYRGEECLGGGWIESTLVEAL